MGGRGGLGFRCWAWGGLRAFRGGKEGIWVCYIMKTEEDLDD
jgi:hypothetical protein